MKLTKSGNNLIIKDIDILDLTRIFKVNVPLKFMFLNKNTVVNNETIDVISRWNIDANSTVSFSSFERGEQLTNYETLLSYIQLRKERGMQVIAVYDMSKLNYGGSELIKLLPKINMDIVVNCAYIGYEESPSRFIISGLPINGLPVQITYYEDNNSMLQYGSGEPILVTDSPKLTSIVDFLCN